MMWCKPFFFKKKKIEEKKEKKEKSDFKALCCVLFVLVGKLST